MTGANTTGRDILLSVKASAGTGSNELRLPVGSPIRAFLRPVATRAESLNYEDIQRLTDWRNRFSVAFLTEFIATYDRTAQWLTDVVGPADNKILFMVDDLEGRTFGQMGLASINWTILSGEADAVIRGEKAPPLLMALAESAMLDWAHDGLGLRTIVARVRSDNEAALKFNRLVGFHETGHVPLRLTIEGGETHWVEDTSIESPEIYVVYLEYCG